MNALFADPFFMVAVALALSLGGICSGYILSELGRVIHWSTGHAIRH